MMSDEQKALRQLLQKLFEGFDDLARLRRLDMRDGRVREDSQQVEQAEEEVATIVWKLRKLVDAEDRRAALIHEHQQLAAKAVSSTLTIDEAARLVAVRAELDRLRASDFARAARRAAKVIPYPGTLSWFATPGYGAPLKSSATGDPAREQIERLEQLAAGYEEIDPEVARQYVATLDADTVQALLADEDAETVEAENVNLGASASPSKRTSSVNWQPIESAPKDRRAHALLWIPRYGVQRGFWDGELWRWAAGDSIDATRPSRAGAPITSQANPPTHWAPLPTGPSGPPKL